MGVIVEWARMRFIIESFWPHVREIAICGDYVKNMAEIDTEARNSISAKIYFGLCFFGLRGGSVKAPLGRMVILKSAFPLT